MEKAALRRRYNSLWLGETVASLVFVAFLASTAYQDGVWQRWIVRTYSLGVVILILMQGIIWWRLKRRLLDQNERTMPPRVLDSYRFWRRINWILIACFPVVVVIAAQISGQPVSSVDTWIGLAIIVGAVLEQINYYY